MGQREREKGMVVLLVGPKFASPQKGGLCRIIMLAKSSEIQSNAIVKEGSYSLPASVS